MHPPWIVPNCRLVVSPRMCSHQCLGTGCLDGNGFKHSILALKNASFRELWTPGDYCRRLGLCMHVVLACVVWCLHVVLCVCVCVCVWCGVVVVCVCVVWCLCMWCRGLWLFPLATIYTERTPQGKDMNVLGTRVNPRYFPLMNMFSNKYTHLCYNSHNTVMNMTVGESRVS